MAAALFSLYQRIILKNAFWVMVLLLAGVGWLSTYIPVMKLDASADALVLEGDTSLEYYREISKRYGSEDFLLVTYQPDGDLFAPEQLQTLDELRGRLALLPNVSSVNSILDIPLLQSPRVSLSQVTGGEIPTLRSPDIDIEQVKAELANSPIYKP